MGYDSNNKAMKMITFINLFDNWIFIYCRGSRENLHHSMRYFLNSLLDTFRPMLGFHKSVLLMKGRFMYSCFCKLLSIIGEFTFCKGIVRTVDNLDNGRLTSSTFLKGFDFNKAKISGYKILISLFVKNN